ncbi:MAG: outer membrane porin, OprD family [Betaproteobacteria bacterium]|nr:outer membrane porin, OprD family [Betaproteobacteria bacterium]
MTVTNTCAVRLPTRGCRVFVAALCALALSGVAGAQGIYPGDLPKDGYKLPGGIEPIVHLRTYYFDSESTSGKPTEAWALGGWLGLRTPWWGDFFQAGANYYLSGKLYGPEGKGGTRLLTSDQDSIYVLGEAFAAFRFAGQKVTAYRQLIDRPFINPNDSRMIPNTFEAYTLSGAADDVSYLGGYITKAKLRDTESFVWMSNVAGGTGDQAGVAFAGMTWKFGQGGSVRLDEQYAVDVFNTFYADVRYPIPLDDKTSLALGAQYYPQTSVGADQIGSFSTWGAGLQAVVNHGPFGGQLSYTQTGTGYSTQNPFGSHPSYHSIQQVDFNSAGEKSWGIRANVDFASLGAPGLTAYVFYVAGTGRLANGTGAPLPDRNETDVRVDYAFAKGTLLEGLSATFRYSWLHEDGAAQTGTQLRAYLNYAVKF